MAKKMLEGEELEIIDAEQNPELVIVWDPSGAYTCDH